MKIRLKIRLWLLPAGDDSRILTGRELRKNDLHPLRLVYLGRFAGLDDPAAIEAARSNIRPPELVMAHNVRVAVDRRQTRRWRLSEQEIDLLRAGDRLRIRDGMGGFAVGYSSQKK